MDARFPTQKFFWREKTQDFAQDKSGKFQSVSVSVPEMGLTRKAYKWVAREEKKKEDELVGGSKKLGGLADSFFGYRTGSAAAAAAAAHFKARA